MNDFPRPFSKQAAAYRRFQPAYPDELFAYLRTLCTEHRLAWDCGTGNGQSAANLTNYFERIIATDPSEQQIQNAIVHPRITYKVEKAEQPSLQTASADLVTIAQALHWFELDKFYAEVQRVLKPNGIIAAWTYDLLSISPEADEVIRYFHDHMVKEFWVEGNRVVERAYADLPFPFEQLHAPVFNMYKELTVDDMIGLLHSWSATQKFIDAKGYDPVENIIPDLLKVWGNSTAKKTASWKIKMKAGRNGG